MLVHLYLLQTKCALQPYRRPPLKIQRRVYNWRLRLQFAPGKLRKFKVLPNQFSPSVACIINTGELHNVGDSVRAGMSLKSMEGMSARAEINEHC